MNKLIAATAFVGGALILPLTSQAEVTELTPNQPIYELDSGARCLWLFIDGTPTVYTLSAYLPPDADGNVFLDPTFPTRAEIISRAFEHGDLVVSLSTTTDLTNICGQGNTLAPLLGIGFAPNPSEPPAVSAKHR